MATRSELAELARQLVRIDSQNPVPGEAECVCFVAQWLGGIGLTPSETPVPGHPPNLVVRLPGRGERPALVLLGHMDTVPVGSGWREDPFAGTLRDDRLYGRGAADMKGGLAVLLLLVRDLLREHVELAGDLIVAATVDEEGPDMAGAAALVQSAAIPRAALVLALEPTDLRLRIAQVGAMWYEVTTVGRMAHAGRAPLGVDANHAMALIVTELKESVAALPYRHPILGAPHLTASRLEGGFKTNVVPEKCRAEFDFRIVPPMTPDDADTLIRQASDRAVRKIPGARVTVRNLGRRRPPVQAPEDSPLVTALKGAFLRVTGRTIEVGGRDGHEAYTDASLVATLTGNPHCTVFGPGNTDVAHTVDEYVDVEQLEVASRVLRELVRSAVGTAA